MQRKGKALFVLASQNNKEVGVTGYFQAKENMQQVASNWTGNVLANPNKAQSTEISIINIHMC